MADLENSLTRYLAAAGENLSGLAERMGRAPSTLTRPLNGERNPSIGLAQDIERATGGKVSAASFLQICMAAKSAKSAAPTGEAA